MKREPIVMVAYQCGPGMGSVSQIGWEWFTGTARMRPVTLVTHVRNRAAIEAAPTRPAGAEVVYIDTEWFAGPLYRLARRVFPHSEHSVFLVSQLDYFLFDTVALRTLRRHRRAGAPWRLLHLVTPVTVSAPTRLVSLGLPVVRGPLNCGLPMPRGFDEVLAREKGGLVRLRAGPRLLEAMLGSLRRSAAVLVATRATRDAVPESARGRCVPMVENAVDLSRFTPAPSLPAPGPGQPLRVSFVGRLVPVKALQLLLQAVAELHRRGHAVELVVAGAGPLLEEWQALARELGIAAQVHWRGALPLEQVAAVMQDSHVFCLPSVRESGGAVLLEAMACARPVIGLDFGGPAEVVDDAVGWKLPMPDAPGVVHALVHTLESVIRDPEDAAARGRAGRQRVVDLHTWPAKIAQAGELYDRILAAPAARPSEVTA